MKRKLDVAEEEEDEEADFSDHSAEYVAAPTLCYFYVPSSFRSLKARGQRA